MLLALPLVATFLYVVCGARQAGITPADLIDRVYDVVDLSVASPLPGCELRYRALLYSATFGGRVDVVTSSSSLSTAASRSSYGLTRLRCGLCSWESLPARRGSAHQAPFGVAVPLPHAGEYAVSAFVAAAAIGGFSGTRNAASAGRNDVSGMVILQSFASTECAEAMESSGDGVAAGFDADLDYEDDCEALLDAWEGEDEGVRAGNVTCSLEFLSRVAPAPAAPAATTAPAGSDAIRSLLLRRNDGATVALLSEERGAGEEEGPTLPPVELVRSRDWFLTAATADTDASAAAPRAGRHSMALFAQPRDEKPMRHESSLPSLDDFLKRLEKLKEGALVGNAPKTAGGVGIEAAAAANGGGTSGGGPNRGISSANPSAAATSPSVRAPPSWTHREAGRLMEALRIGRSILRSAFPFLYGYAGDGSFEDALRPAFAAAAAEAASSPATASSSFSSATIGVPPPLGDVLLEVGGGASARAAAEMEANIAAGLEAGGIPGLDKLMDSVLKPMLQPVVGIIGGALTSTLGDSMTKMLGGLTQSGLKSEVTAQLSHSLASSLTEALVPPLTASITDAVTNTLPAMLRDAVTEAVVERLTVSLSASVSQTLSRLLADQLALDVPDELAPMLSAELTHFLTQSVTQSVVPALVYTLHHSPAEDYFCSYCASFKLYCAYCQKNGPEQLQRSEFYAAYYSNHFAKEYSGVRASELEIAPPVPPAKR